MANASSTTTSTDPLNHMCDAINENVNDSKKRKLTPEQCRQLTDKLLEIEQLEYEEHLACERLNSINAEKQHLQNLLNRLQTMDTDDRMKTPRSRRRQSQKVHSNSRLN